MISLDEAKHLIWLIANKEHWGDKSLEYPFEPNIARKYNESVVDLHNYIMGLVAPERK